jgi:hypothetical protein
MNTYYVIRLGCNAVPYKVWVMQYKAKEQGATEFKPAQLAKR